MYVRFNSRNAGNPTAAREELIELIAFYANSEHSMFRDFADLLERYQDPIVNSFVMVEKMGNGKIYNSRLSNGPIESINRKVKDLKRLGRGFRNFEHFRNRFLYAARTAPILNGVTDYSKRQTMRQSLKSTPPIIGDVASCIRPEDYLTMA